MKRNDIIAIAVLLVLLFAWPIIDRTFFLDRFEQDTPAPQQEVSEAQEQAPLVEGEPASILAENETLAAPAAMTSAELEPAPAKEVILKNDRLHVVVSSRGASIVSAELEEYRSKLDVNSDPVVLDFSEGRALRYVDMGDVLPDRDFDVLVSSEGDRAVCTLTTPDGVVLKRTLQLTDSYLLKVVDVFENKGSQEVTLPEHGLSLGTMGMLETESVSRYVVPMGVDTLLIGGKGVEHWGKKVGKWLKRSDNGTIENAIGQASDWAAVKNTYFAQILTPEGGSEDVIIYARESAENKNMADRIGAVMTFPSTTIGSNDSFTREFAYYVGPKKYAELHEFGLHQVDVMEFGMWRAIGKVLLVVLNWIYEHIPPHNYGFAIMLLTIIVRVVFWPLMHKQTESFKKMADLQPQMQEINEKFKDDPQKKQKAVMALYKEHKVNPLGGCLPMLVQIPVFIALFVVLRSAIELRFAEFLWISDLSKPEGLFADVLPMPLNILPIFMALTMMVQQKLTPQAGDPKQQKMMATIMPVMMLFIMYNFASGLCLYWTTQNLLMIVQLVLRKRKQ